MTTYTSQYPTQDGDHVKATTTYSSDYHPYFATDPSKSLTGAWVGTTWVGENPSATNQRFHIDLGSAKIIKRIYYENRHYEGLYTEYGVKNFTFWGSNTGTGTFDDLVYANDDGWTQLTTASSLFDEHTDSDVADPKYILVTNTTAYRYYAFKFADNWGGAETMGVRRIELQTEDAAGWINIAKVNGMTATGIAKVNGVAVGSIAKVNGVVV